VSFVALSLLLFVFAGGMLFQRTALSTLKLAMSTPNRADFYSTGTQTSRP